MSSDMYSCSRCGGHQHHYDMYVDKGLLYCRGCAAIGLKDIKLNTTNMPERSMLYTKEEIAKALSEVGHKLSPQPDNSHYKMGGIDPCQYVEAMGTAEFRGACVLNILKYLTRYPYKGTPLMDLAKAQDYLNKLIEHEKAKEIAK